MEDILEDFLDLIIYEFMIVFLLLLFGYNIDRVIFEKYIIVEGLWGRMVFDLFIGKVFFDISKLVLNSVFKVRIDKFLLILVVNLFIFGRFVGRDVNLFDKSNILLLKMDKKVFLMEFSKSVNYMGKKLINVLEFFNIKCEKGDFIFTLCLLVEFVGLMIFFVFVMKVFFRYMCMKW